MKISGDVISAQAMKCLGAALADVSVRGDIIFLTGCLGAGKTTLAQGFMRKLGVTEPVKSPTYSLVETYDTPLGRVHHFDCYRMQHPQELIDMGIEDFLDPNVLCLFEWPERGQGVLPSPTVHVELEVLEHPRRYATIQCQEAHILQRCKPVEEIMAW